MSKHLAISYADLRRLYVDERLSTVQIARRYGCSPATIATRLKELGIPSRATSEATRLGMGGIQISDTELRRQYVDEKLSSYEISQRSGCSPDTILNRLREYGIPIRSLSEAILAERGIAVSCEQLQELYGQKKLSIYKIAKQIGCSPNSIYSHLLQCDLKPRSWREAVTLHPKQDFNGTLEKKAYLIGFRLGDLHVSKMGKTGEVVRVACCSTRREQLSLFQTLFEPYGFVWLGRLRKTGNREFVAYLNLSFSFLLPKQDQIESWILQSDSAFIAFWAGYVDAEGCFTIGHRSTGEFKVSSYDIGILRASWQKLQTMGVQLSKPRLKRLAGTPDKKGIVNRKDVWELATGRKASVLCLCDLLSPYLKHSKRREDMEKVRQNVVMRNANPDPR